MADNNENNGSMTRSESYVAAANESSTDDVIDGQQSSDSTVVLISEEAKRKAAAQAAFKEGDVEASKAVHDSMPAEAHDAFGDYVKAGVFGGLDGIITTFAVVASVAGADLKVEVVLVMGFANLLADGVSMAFGEYIGEDAEIKYKKVERKREAWELSSYPEGEVKEMIDLYKEKGFSEEDANTVINTMSKYPEFFVDHMMVQELGLLPPEEGESPLKGSIVIFVSFLIFGLVPLLAYVCFSTVLDKEGLFGLSIGLTALALFALGAFSSRFAASSWYRQGFFVMMNGATAAAVSYLVGWFMTEIVDVDEC